MLHIADLRYAWPRADADTVDIPSFDVEAGERVFLHGPSGGGKSTLLGLLAGVLLAREGRVEVMGTDWRDLGAGRRDRFRADHVGVLFQQFNLLPWLDAIGNVLLPCRFSSRRRDRAAGRHGSPERAARHLLERMALPPTLWSAPAASLSVGQQQRVAAARTLIGAPELVIADEPTSALDAALRDGFMALLLAECAAASSTLVFVSHDERLAASFDRAVALSSINRVTGGAAAAAAATTEDAR